jgi:hypothetical protein
VTEDDFEDEDLVLANYGGDQSRFFVCSECSAVVADKKRHVAWHNKALNVERK